MARKIFVNLAVKRLDKSMEFFKKIGFTFNPQFTDETAACMVISDDIYAMLLTEKKFRDFTKNKDRRRDQDDGSPHVPVHGQQG